MHVSRTLSVARHEAAETFWMLWRAAEGAADDSSFWPSIAPALARLDILQDDPALAAASRRAIAKVLNEMRGCGAATRGEVEGHLRQLGNVVLAILERVDCTYRRPALDASTYLKVLRAVVRADDAEPQTLNHSTLASDVARHGRLDRATVQIGIGLMIDEGLAEYEWEPPGASEEALRILDDMALSSRIEELEEEVRMSFEATFPVRHAEPLRPDYKDLIRGIARKHNLAADGSPASGEIYLEVADRSGDLEAFKRNLEAFKMELEGALAKPGPSTTSGSHTSVTIHGHNIASPLQAGSPGATQQVWSSADVDMSKVRETFFEAKHALEETTLDEDVREAVDGALANIEAQISKDKPNPKLLLPLATSLAALLSTTGAVGQGVEYIQKVIHFLGG